MKENLLKLSTIVRAAFVGACTSLVLAACTPGDKAAQSGTDGDSEVTIGLTYIPNIQFSPVYVADAQGTYADNGIVPTIRHHGSHEGFFTALLAGEEDVVIASGDEAAFQRIPTSTLLLTSRARRWAFRVSTVRTTMRRAPPCRKLV